MLRRLPKLEGRELAFGSYLFTSARHACYDLIERRRRSEPTGEPPEPPDPEPGDPGDDPERHLLLEASQEEIRRANAQLPERQREVLALRELEELSYDEIAEGQAGPPGGRGRRLARRPHARLRDLPTGREAMEEAGLSYRSWAPVAAAPLLFRETVAHAAETVGADWKEVGRRGHSPLLRHMRRDLALMGALTLVLFFVALAAKTHEGAPVTEAVPAAEETPAAAVKAGDREKPANRKAKKEIAPELPAVAPGEPTSLSSNGSDAPDAPPSQEPSRKVTVDRDAVRNGTRGLTETLPRTVPEELPAPEPLPEPQPQPEPQPEPPSTEPPCITRVCQRGPD